MNLTNQSLKFQKIIEKVVLELKKMNNHNYQNLLDFHVNDNDKSFLYGQLFLI